MDHHRPLLCSLSFLSLMMFYFLGSSQREDIHSEIKSYSKLYGQIFQTIDDHYVDSVDRKKILLKSLKSLTHLDRFSKFLPPSTSQTFYNKLNGKGGSIGINLLMENKRAFVSGVLFGSPAQNILYPNDEIIKIDGLSVKDKTSFEIRKMIDLNNKDSVDLSILRKNKELEINIVKGHVKLPSLRFSHLVDSQKKIAYIYMRRFSKNVVDEFKIILKKLEKESEDLESLILDLRGNPGGDLRSAIDFCDLFLKEGLIVATVGNNNGKRNFIKRINATPTLIFSSIKVHIIIDSESASASELVSACLKERGIATIWGETSFGKCSVQTLYDFKNDFLGDLSIKLTTDKFYTFEGFTKTPRQSFSDIGVTPNFIMSMGDKKERQNRKYAIMKSWNKYNYNRIQGIDHNNAIRSLQYFKEIDKSDPVLQKIIIFIQNKQNIITK